MSISQSQLQSQQNTTGHTAQGGGANTPSAVQNRQREEYFETLNQCFTFIETSHQDISIIKVSIQSLVELNSSNFCTPSDRLRIFNLLLDIIQSPLLYRKTIIRGSIKSIGTLSCQDESLITQSITFLAKILEFQCENYQYMKRSCFHALSRIGRKYPIYQTILISLFEQYFMNPNSSKNDICSILLAFGRFSQTNSQIRVLSMKRWLEAIENPHYLFKSAGILSIGYASCPTGNIVNDKNIESICYSKSIELLQYHRLNDLKPGEEDPWKKEDIYLVQMAACKALGLLARSNPEEWLPRLQKIFKAVLSSTRYSGHVKSVVLRIYGQLTYDLSNSSAFFSPIKVLLFELSNEDNLSISSPSFYSLVKFALSHTSNYQAVHEMLKIKLIAGSSPSVTSPDSMSIGAILKHAKQDQIVHFLKTWAKLISRNYRPNINQCSSIISPFYSDLYEPSSPLANQMVLFKNRPKAPASPAVNSNIYISQQSNIDNPFANYSSLVLMCRCFSPLVINSILSLIKKPSLLSHIQYKKALKEKIKSQKVVGFPLDPLQQLEPQYQLILKELSQDPKKREIFIQLINNPEIVETKEFQENIKSQYESLENKPSDPRLKKNPLLKPLPMIKPSNTQTTSPPDQKETQEKERLGKEKQEKERLEKDKLEKEKQEKEKQEKERLEKEKSEKVEKERLEKERLDKEEKEKEKVEKERLEKEKLENERLEKERLEKEKLEKEKKMEEKKKIPDLPLMKPSIAIYELPKITPPIKTNKISNTQQNLGMKLMGTTMTKPKSNPFSKPLPLMKSDDESDDQPINNNNNNGTTTSPVKSNPFSKPLPLMKSENSGDSSTPAAPVKLNPFSKQLPLMKSEPKIKNSIEKSKSNPFSKPLPLMKSENSEESSTPVGSVKSNPFSKPLPLMKIEKKGEKPKSNPFSKPLPMMKSSNDQKNNIEIEKEEEEEEEEENTNTEDEIFEPFQIDIDSYSNEIVNMNDDRSTTATKPKTAQDNEGLLMIEDEMNVDSDSSCTPSISNNNTRKRPNSLLELEDDDLLNKKICLDETIDKSLTIDLSNTIFDLNSNSNGNTTITEPEPEPEPEPTPLPVIRTNTTPICSFYLLGICKKGSECNFLHEGPLRKLDICKFYKTGSCLKGSDCTYSHDLKQEACKFYNSPSGCAKPDCPYGHFIQENISPPVLSNTNSPPASPIQTFASNVLY